MSAALYERITQPDAKGKALYRRVSDGKVARVKTTWFESSEDGGWMPRSKTKALRLEVLKWENAV